MQDAIEEKEMRPVGRDGVFQWYTLSEPENYNLLLFLLFNIRLLQIPSFNSQVTQQMLHHLQNNGTLLQLGFGWSNDSDTRSAICLFPSIFFR